MAIERSVDHLGDGRALAFRIGVGVERFLEQGAEIGEMRRLAQIFLGDLELHHQRCFRHGAEEGMEGFARLEVDRAIFDLHQHIVGELSVERLEVGIGLFGAIVGIVMGVDEGAPHDDAAMGLDRGGEHVGPIGMRAVIILRTGLAFAVRLDQEAAEIGDGAVDLIRLRLPPGGDLRVERIGGLEPVKLHRRGPFDRQIDPDAIGPENVGQRGRLGDIGCGEAVGLGIHIVEDGAVDPDRGVGAGIIGVARPLIIGQAPPVPDRHAGIAALHRAIQIVPMVEQAQADARRAANVEPVERSPGLGEAQPMKDAVQHPDVAVGGDQRDRLPALVDGSDGIAFRSKRLQRYRQVGGRIGRRQPERASARGHGQGRRGSGHAHDGALQFLRSGAQRRAIRSGGDGVSMRADVCSASLIRRRVAKPEIIAILRAAGERQHHHGHGRHIAEQARYHSSLSPCPLACPRQERH